MVVQFRQSNLDDYWSTGCGWVPANSALTPGNIIADPNPWGSHGDLRLLPDKNSRVTITNGPEKDAPIFDFIHCDLVETDGKMWGCCPRTLLKQEIERYKDSLGMSIVAAFEHEFTLTGTKHLISPPAFSLTAQRRHGRFASWLMSALQAGNVQPEMFLPEFGHNQYEVTCRPTDALSAADRAINIREITREIARQMDLNVTFSPLTSADAVANGVHLHLSVKDLNGKPLFYEEGRRYDLSMIGEYWSAGVIKHLPALCALTAPTPVSYLRLKPHHWSAAYACLGFRNREAAVRISPTVSFGNKSIGEQYNLEYRAMDGTASPHLALASILIAGRLGIEQQLELTSVSNIDPHELSENERLAKHIFSLPDNLNNALEILYNDKQLFETLPKPLTDTYFAVKHQELLLTNEMDRDALCQYYAKIY